MDWLLVYLGVVALTLCISIIVRKDHTKPIRRITYLLAYILVSESVGYYFRTHGFNNKFLFYFYQPVEYLFFCYLYAAHFVNASVRSWVIRVGWLFVVFSIGYTIWAYIESNLTEDPVALSIIEWTLMFPLILYYFYELYRSDEVIILTQQPLFWINTGNFLFYSGTFFLMGLIEEVKKFDAELADRLFLINTLLNIVLYTFWTIGFLCLRKKYRYSF